MWPSLLPTQLTKKHWTGLKRIMRYTKGTVSLCRNYEQPKIVKPTLMHTDSDWAGD